MDNERQHLTMPSKRCQEPTQEKQEKLGRKPVTAVDTRGYCPAH
jgi:hypothetical protein